MNKKAQLQFITRCASLIEAGISLSNSIEIIKNMEKSKRKVSILENIIQKLNNGISFSKSLRQSYKDFDHTLLTMTSYGESTGILPITLRQAASLLEKRSEIKKKIIGALVYPAFIALATLAMSLFLVMYIFPKIIPLLSSMDIQLPFLTRVVKAIYEQGVHYGLYITILILMACLFTFYLYKSKKALKTIIQNILLGLPVIGELIKKYTLSIFFQSSGTLLESGQSLTLVIKNGASFSILEPYKNAWGICLIETTKGNTLSQSMILSKKLFPQLVTDMLQVGEKTGTISSMFLQIGKIYEEEMDSFIKNFSSAIEPVLMIAMGLIVGSIALSIILPIYEITNHLGH